MDVCYSFTQKTEEAIVCEKADNILAWNKII